MKNEEEVEMDAAGYREALRTLNLSQVAGGKVLGVDARSSRRYANGERKIPNVVSRILRYLIVTKTPPATFLKKLGIDAGPLTPSGEGEDG